MIKHFLFQNNKYLIFLFIIVNQNLLSGFSQASEHSFQTRSGEYEIYIPVLKLPEFSRVSLVEVGPVGFPLLPEWNSISNAILLNVTPLLLNVTGVLR